MTVPPHGLALLGEGGRALTDQNSAVARCTMSNVGQGSLGWVQRRWERAGAGHMLTCSDMSSNGLDSRVFARGESTYLEPL